MSAAAPRPPAGSPANVAVAACHSDWPLARARVRRSSTVFAPMPRVGRFTTRSNDASSSRFAMSRR